MISHGISAPPYQMPANEHAAVMLHLNENLLLDEAMEPALVRGLTLDDLHRYPPGGIDSCARLSPRSAASHLRRCCLVRVPPTPSSTCCCALSLCSAA